MGRPKTSYGNYIIISKASNYNQRTIATTSSFFNGEIIVKICTEKLMFLIPTMSYNGKTYKCYHKKSNWKTMTILCDIPKGKYLFDEEESTEDCKVIYFKN